jgi:dipeptidyl aminopeptidase/acylaminoacyl peptidase
MKVRMLAAAILAAFFGVRAEAAPLEVYGRLPTLEQVAISPDGNALASVRIADAKRLVIIQSLQTYKTLGAIDVGDKKLRDLSWADDKHLLVTTSTTAQGIGLIGPRLEWSTAQVFNVDTQKVSLLIGRNDSGVKMMNVIAGAPRIRNVGGHVVAFVEGLYFPTNESRHALFRVDLDTGHITFILGGSDYADWIVDGRGAIVARSDYDDLSQHWFLQVYVSGTWRTALDVPATIEIPDVGGLTPDGAAVLVEAPNNGHVQIQQVSLKDASLAPAPQSLLEFSHVILDRSSGRIIGGSQLTDKTDYRFFSPRAETVWRSAAAAFPNAGNVALVSWSDDWNKLILHVSGANYGDGYYLVDMTDHKADLIGPEYEGIGPDDYAPVKWITYVAGDGRQISGYLTLPKNRAPQNLPLIVMPHGGPHARDLPGFDWLSQAIASRGYAVLQPQFRGSDGFGWDLLSAGFGEFGRKMQTDLSDGVRALAAKGTIDPKRVCIVGASYGGYAALAGATMDTGVYRCAVADAGLSDLRDFLRYMRSRSKDSNSLSVRFWDRFLGVSAPDDPALDAISPIKHVDKATIPILLIHGRDDTVVPIAQSEDMADALKDAGKKVEFVKLDGEDHWLSRSETRLQMLDATVKFVEANNPPN